jgi:predicted dehydrogenase
MAEFLGEARFVESHRLGPPSPRVKDVGVILDLMIHDLDLVLSLVDSPVRSMESFGVPILTNREDIANARIRFENGCVANLTVSRVTPERQRKLRIFQRDMYLSLDYLSQRLDVFRRAFDPESGDPRIDHEVVIPPKHDALTQELGSFIESVKTGRPPVVSGSDGRKALDLGIQIVENLQGL